LEAQQPTGAARAVPFHSLGAVDLTLTTKVLLGLAAGLIAGALVTASQVPALQVAVGWIEPLGTIWINALRMTIVPLVVAGLIVGAASARDARSLGRLGGRALALFFVLLGAAAAFTVAVAPLLLTWLPVDPGVSAALRESAGGAAAAAGADVAAAAQRGFPDLRQWLVDLVPANAVRSAADGAILPLIVFSVAFGLAVSRIAGDERDTIIRFFRGLFDAMLTLVRWILTLAPIGVFALALPLATRLGFAAAGAVLYYIVVVVAICVVFIALMYPLAVLLGGVPPRRFARGAAPAQSIAFSARSSLASLPAMIDGGAKHLAFGPQITGFFLPLSASMFRLGGAIGIPAGVIFVCRLYGIPLGPAELATIALTSVLLTFSVPGVPGGSILIMVPVLLAVGAPPEGIGILLGVDTIPDMFRTTANVTGTMTAATMLSKEERAEADALPPPVQREGTWV
jgi:proton glutamate symport protein